MNDLVFIPWIEPLDIEFLERSPDSALERLVAVTRQVLVLA